MSYRKFFSPEKCRHLFKQSQNNLQKCFWLAETNYDLVCGAQIDQVWCKYGNVMCGFWHYRNTQESVEGKMLCELNVNWGSIILNRELNLVSKSWVLHCDYTIWFSNLVIQVIKTRLTFYMYKYPFIRIFLITETCSWQIAKSDPNYSKLQYCEALFFFLIGKTDRMNLMCVYVCSESDRFHSLYSN